MGADVRHLTGEMFIFEMPVSVHFLSTVKSWMKATELK